MKSRDISLDEMLGLWELVKRSDSLAEELLLVRTSPFTPPAEELLFSRPVDTQLSFTACDIFLFLERIAYDTICILSLIPQESFGESSPIFGRDQIIELKDSVEEDSRIYSYCVVWLKLFGEGFITAGGGIKPARLV